MLKTILLVVDSQSVEHASLDLTLRWATSFDAMVVALGIVDEAGIISLESVPLGAGEAKRARDVARVEQYRMRIEARLSEIATRCATAQVAFKPLEAEGWTLEQIQLEAQRFDLIVMAPRDGEKSSGFDCAPDSPLVGLLRATPRPVVVVPEQASVGESILIAYDGSLQAARALQAFATAGLSKLGPIHVIAVDDDPAEAARRGDRAVDFLAHHGITARLHPIARTGAPAEHLLDMAQRLGAGLLVMGAYGKSQIREFFLGSVTRSVLTQCQVPLFLYH